MKIQIVKSSQIWNVSKLYACENKLRQLRLRRDKSMKRAEGIVEEMKKVNAELERLKKETDGAVQQLELG